MSDLRALEERPSSVVVDEEAEGLALYHEMREDGRRVVRALIARGEL